MSGQPVDEPMEWEDLFIHWKSHVKKMQESSFKESPVEVKESFLEHLGITEMLMHKRAGKNGLFRQKLLQLDSYPLVFELDTISAATVAGANPAMLAGNPEELSEGPVEELQPEVPQGEEVPQGVPVGENS